MADEKLINELLSRKLTADQVKAVQKLIDKYIDRLDTGTLSVNFPPWWFYVVIVFINVGLIAALLMLPSNETHNLAEYITHHVTIAIVVISAAVIIHSLAAYILKQYYSFIKYRIITINRIAIFATSALTDGQVKDDTLKSLIADLPGPDSDLKTIYEKLLDNVTSVAKTALKTIGKDAAK